MRRLISSLLVMALLVVASSSAPIVVKDPSLAHQQVVELPVPVVNEAIVHSGVGEEQNKLDVDVDQPIHLQPITTGEEMTEGLTLDEEEAVEGIDTMTDSDIEGLETSADNIANGELVDIEGDSDIETNAMLEGVVEEQDLEAVEGISDNEMELDGDTTSEIDTQGTEADVSTTSIDDAGTSEAEEEGITVIRPKNEGSVEINYNEINIGRRGGRSMRGLHGLARRARLMRRLLSWLKKPSGIRSRLLSFRRFHKLRSLEFKLRVLKLKLLTDAIKMMRLARFITAMKVKGDLTKMMIAHRIFNRLARRSSTSKFLSRLAKIRSFKPMLSARRRGGLAAAIRSSLLDKPSFYRQQYHFTSAPVRRQSARNVWAIPQHLLPLAGVDASYNEDGLGLMEVMYPSAPIISSPSPLSQSIYTQPILYQYPFETPFQGEELFDTANE